jgi:hypothetical protein
VKTLRSTVRELMVRVHRISPELADYHVCGMDDAEVERRFRLYVDVGPMRRMRPVWIYLLFGSMGTLPAIYVGITGNPGLRSREYFEGRGGLPAGSTPEHFVPVVEIATRNLGYIVESALAQTLRQRLPNCVVVGGFLSRRIKVSGPVFREAEGAIGNLPIYGMEGRAGKPMPVEKSFPGVSRNV